MTSRSDNNNTNNNNQKKTQNAFHIGEGEDETLHMAAYAGNQAMCILRLNQKTSKVTSRDEDGRTPIHWAAAGGHASVFEFLLGQLETDEQRAKVVNKKDDGGWTPLHSATSSGHLEVVKLLVEKYLCNVNLKNDNGQIALHYVKKNEIIASILIPKTKDLNIQAKRGQTTPLMKSVMIGCSDIVNQLISTDKIEINLQDASGNTALHLAYEAGYQEIVQILESKGKASKSIANKEKKLPSQMRRN